MKFVSAVLVAFAASSVQAGFIRRRMEEEDAVEEMPVGEPTYIPPQGFKPIVWPTPPSPPVAAPVAAPVEEPVEEPAEEPAEGVCEETFPRSIDDEYIVIQYDNTVSLGCLDLDDPVTQKAMSDSFVAAYSSSDGCAQEGAFCGIYTSEFVGQDKDSSNFLLRVGSYCNSWVFLNDDQDVCGIELFDSQVEARALQFSGEECSCPRPSTSDVINALNTGVETVLSIICPAVPASPGDEGVVARPESVPFVWAQDAYQLCETDCVPDQEENTFTYTADGVSAPCDKPDISAEPTEAPSDEPTEAPTETLEPTGAPTSVPTEEAPSEEPTEPPTEESEPTVGPTEPVEPTEEPVEPTEAPVDATEAPVDATEAPVDATEAPVDATEAPVDATEAPTKSPTGSPTGSPTKSPDDTEEPVGDSTKAPAE